jgi:hypothetical protein
MMKRSRLTKCQCGFIHITQGPCSCWVCQNTLTFYAWQTSKPEEIRTKKPLACGKELKLDPGARWWNPDPRDRVKDDVYQMCWPENPGFGTYEEQEQIYAFNPSPPPTLMGYKVINKQFNL